MDRLVLSAMVGMVCLVSDVAMAKDKTICINVKIRHYKSSQEKPEAPPNYLPNQTSRKNNFRTKKVSYPIDPREYLKRMLVHYVMHERGYRVVEKGCDYQVSVELYPLVRGWTAFARYTRYQQEEKIDQVTYAEFPRLAKRVVLALLYNRSVESTIDRLSVLKADSTQSVETIKGANHFVLAVGSGFKIPVAGLKTAVAGKPNAEATIQFRLLTPVNLQLGHRRTFSSWSIESYARLGIGVAKKAQRNNMQGGHVDHSTDFGLGMSIYWYTDPNAFNTLYIGSGASFDINRYSVVKPESDDLNNSELLYGAGLTVNVTAGYEFIRTSNVRPFTQLELNLPAYLVSTENSYSSINAWIPGVTVVAGMMF